MPDPFSSEYARTPQTRASIVTEPARTQTPELPTAQQVSIDPNSFGFEPELYGLGKPRRVILRGKISSD